MAGLDSARKSRPALRVCSRQAAEAKSKATTLALQYEDVLADLEKALNENDHAHLDRSLGRLYETVQRIAETCDWESIDRELEYGYYHREAREKLQERYLEGGRAQQQRKARPHDPFTEEVIQELKPNGPATWNGPLWSSAVPVPLWTPRPGGLKQLPRGAFKDLDASNVVIEPVLADEERITAGFCCLRPGLEGNAVHKERGLRDRKFDICAPCISPRGCMQPVAHPTEVTSLLGNEEEAGAFQQQGTQLCLPACIWKLRRLFGLL